MNAQTLRQIRDATHGKPINADPAAAIQSISTDSRNIPPNSLFIALTGDNHDGHDHIEMAAKNGAIAAIVQRSIATDLPLILVDDTRKAMGRLANHIRRQFRGTVIAVAGSNGKTGTKNLIHAVLKKSLTGSISPRSFNNDVGVPSAIFAADSSDDYLVLEVGTNHPGEILNLTKIAEPDIAVITNIGAEHLEFLGDLDGVTRENAQIISGLNPRGVLIINGDQSDGGVRHETGAGPGPVSHQGVSLIAAAAEYPGRILTFGFDPTNDLSAVDIRCKSDGVTFHLSSLTAGRGSPGLRALDRERPGFPLPAMKEFAGKEFPGEIFVPLMGRHTAVNALAAIAVARHLGVADGDILAGLAVATGPEMRLQLQTAGRVTILNDAYNANPHSMIASLSTLRDMEIPGRRVAILGDMLELGPAADRYHREIGQFAVGCELDRLVCVGEKAALIADAAIAAGMPGGCIDRYTNAAAAATDIAAIIGEDDLVLLKASRGMKLEIVAAAIQALAAGEGLRRSVAARTRRILKVPSEPVSS